MGRWCAPPKERSHLSDRGPPLLSLRRGVCHPSTRVHVRLLGPCFKTGRQRHQTRGDLPSSVADGHPLAACNTPPEGGATYTSSLLVHRQPVPHTEAPASAARGPADTETGTIRDRAQPPRRTGAANLNTDATNVASSVCFLQVSRTL